MESGWGWGGGGYSSFNFYKLTIPLNCSEECQKMYILTKEEIIHH